ncbi:thioredoxin [Roseiarcaceae bacterium H3SJ34-1]|uniref:thioredoxin n=1 Tax=Terripilifer ovatus TaxID=3032367 RepID=UPI003AB9B698|nr:thioredoxin [Roseiarcaceae bacterium H3SJ34-1]
MTDEAMIGAMNGDALASAGQDLVKDVTSASFRVDVIAESARQPVLVDFWAPWCEPCKQLAPVLEKVVRSTQGKVRLVKMNIDEHPQIAGQLGIKSIPAVIAFQRGQPIDGFMGALPESQIKNFIERLIGPVTGAIDEVIAEAETAFGAGAFEAAAEGFAAALDEDPASMKALGGLARALVGLGDLEQARAALSQVPKGSENDPAITAAQAAIEIAAQAENLDDAAELKARVEANPADHQARFDLALALSAKGQREEAADQLIEIIRKDRTWNDDGARKQLVQFFEAWGHMDPDTITARRKLSTALFS